MKQTLEIGRKKYEVIYDHRGNVDSVFDLDKRKRRPFLLKTEWEPLLAGLPESCKRQMANNLKLLKESISQRVASCETFLVMADGGELRLSVNGADVRFRTFRDGDIKVRITDDEELPRECGHKELARISGEIIIRGYDCDDNHGSHALSGQFTVTRSDNGNFYFIRRKI